MRRGERSGASDEDLLRGARSGDEEALAELVDRNHAAVYRVALLIVSEPDLAQDVAQDAFLKAFRALPGFRGEASFRTWLLTITANAARGVLRRRGRLKESDLEGVPAPASEEASPEELATSGGEAARARALMARLPEKQRMSVQLRIDEGLSFKEIGEIIGSSEGAARVNYFHGIRRLREWME